MTHALLVSGHPDLDASYANATIVRSLADALPDATVHRLDLARGAGHRFDLAAERALLDAADVVVLGSPFYWYSWSGLMQEWVEQVWDHGWACNSLGGLALDGKPFILSLTAGGDEPSYSPGGYEPHPVADYLAPVTRTLEFVGAKLLGTVVAYDLPYRAPELNTDKRTSYDDALAAHVERLAALIEGTTIGAAA